MSRARRGTGEQTGVSFPCLNSSPATVRARHVAVAGFRPEDGKRQKSRAKRRPSSLKHRKFLVEPVA
ncbi:hypothetical protein [Pantoea ananatis]|uniref:hypothetical protein n=1 Tax=Pantoea ananas TaxID=553 RepID=UPI001B318457|nr:hypothetical protein [Pantoea ananatis]